MNQSALELFFSKYLWMGLLWLALALLLQEQIGKQHFIVHALIELVKTVAISVVVASIFSFTLGTAEFVGKIKDLLEDVVVSRNFLGNLSGSGKREALKSLLKAPARDKGGYQHIERYYENYVGDTLGIENKNVRSNYSINATAFYDSDSKRVGVKSIYSYRLYPSADGYKDLKIGFDEGDELSTVEKIVVNMPDGTRTLFDNINFTSEEKAGSKDRIAIFPLNDYSETFEHLDIEAHMIEYGADHWFMYTFKALQPTDGFRFYLKCECNLEVRNYSVFDTGKAYHVDRVGVHEISVNCYQWIKEGVGLAILISYPHVVDSSILVDNKALGKEKNTTLVRTRMLHKINFSYV